MSCRICRSVQRKADEQSADGDTSAFLRSCNIVVEIEHDITPHIDRAIESPAAAHREPKSFDRHPRHGCRRARKSLEAANRLLR
jgi:hypothetical protein